MQANTQIGTPYYMPPEIYRYQKYNTKFDIWSLGCVLYEMMAFFPPFNGKTLVDLKYKIFSGKYNSCALRPYAPELRNIVSLTLNTNPTARPTIDQILKLPALSLKISTLKLSMTTDYNIKPLFFEPYNIPRKPSDWADIIKKYSNPIIPSVKLPHIPSAPKKSYMVKSPKVAQNPIAKPLYVTPHPPNKPKQYLYHPKSRLPILPKANPRPEPNKAAISPPLPQPQPQPQPLPQPQPQPQPPPQPQPQPPQNIIIHKEHTPILSNADNKEIMDIDLSIDKLMLSIKELRAQLNIKLNRLEHLKNKRKTIIDNNHRIIVAGNNHISPHPPLAPISQFKKKTDNIPSSQEKLHLHKPTPLSYLSPKSRLIIKIGSRHDSNYFLNH